MIGALNPNEFEALQRYAPLFIDDAQRELADADVDVEGQQHRLRGHRHPATPAMSA